MQCLPLYSLVMALGNVTINYLSLDIEGAELPVLQTLPWDSLDIEVMTVETNHAGEVFPGTRQEARDYLALRGYVFIPCLQGESLLGGMWDLDVGLLCNKGSRHPK